MLIYGVSLCSETASGVNEAKGSALKVFRGGFANVFVV